jgi:hypothetical protein
MYEILLFVEFVLIQEGAAMLFFYFIFFLYKKKHIIPNLNRINQPTMAKKTKKKTPLEASTPKKCKPSPLIVMPTKKLRRVSKKKL